MDYQTLILSIENHVATVTLNRPQVCNAFDETTIAELDAVFQALGKDEALRVIVLAASGPAFCAGGDLNWMKRMAGFSHEQNCEDALALARMLHTIHTCPKPVLAKVQGDCFGGGVGLTAVCDIAICVEEAGFSLSEAKLGLIPATISPYVIRAMGEQAARRYFLTAERFSAREALRIGFLHAVVPADELDAACNGVVKALLGNGPHAVKEAKRLVRDVAGREVNEELIVDTARRIADIRSSEEGTEGIKAFLEKRKPTWLS
ncbi:MAG TPA: enoyl-CoA hydratase/isomerase family protein [Noviherbaspirillum sp.]